jgi:hypothetical protein
MNRRRRRSLKLQLRAAPTAKVVSRSSPKFSLKIILPGILLALLIAGALGFAAVNLLKNARLKHLGHTQVASPSATASPMVVGTENPVPVTSPSQVASVAAKPTPSPPATPVSRPPATPVSRPPASVSDASPHDAKPPSETARKGTEQGRREAERKTPSPPATPVSRPTASVSDASPHDAKPPSETARKGAEQGRREAERKRARLEALHKSHQISDEAYKKGQQEYQTEMSKYRSSVAGGHSPSE